MFKPIFAGAILVFAATQAWAQAADGAIARRAPILEALPDSTTEARPPVRDFVAGQAPGELLATDLLGLTVYAYGSAIGTIDNVLLAETGKPLLIVLDVSSYLDTEKRVAFAFDALGFARDADDVRLVVSVDRETLEEAPAFTSLADEMALHDAQSITEEETEPKSAAPAPSN